MKKLFFAIAIFASLQAFDAQAQKSPAAVKAAVEKAAVATENPKQNAKVATWVKYGQTHTATLQQTSGLVCQHRSLL